MILVPLLLLGATLSADPFNLDAYDQDFEVEFVDEAAAAKARLEVLPLYHGLEQAFSSRWDDNSIDHLRVKEVMEKNGMKGTFFLNASDGWCAPSEAGVKFEGDPRRDLAPALVKGGHSIGAHSLSHEFVPFLNRNRQFHEVLGCKVDRELNSQSPVSAYAFSFLSIRNELEGEVSQRDLAEILARSGFIHISEHPFERRLKTGFSMGYLICGDGGGPMGDLDFDKELAKARAGAEKKLWAVSMHAWAKDWGGPQFSKLDAVYREHAGKKDWWYCNQNEYAAYAYQARHGALKAQAQGRVLRARLRRFEALELNDDIALTLKVAGVKAGEVKAVRAARAKAASIAPLEGSFAFDLPHDPGHAAPQAFGLEAAGLEGSLEAVPGGVKLDLKAGAEALTDVRVTLRLPLKYKDGVLRKRLGGLKPGEARQVQWNTAPGQSGANYTDDRTYLAAQVDAWRGGKAVRAYVQAFDAAPDRDPAYPKGGFLILGPLGADQAAKALRAAEDATPPDCVEAGGRKTCWAEAPAALAGQLSPEIIVAGGKNNSRSFYTWDASLHHPGPGPLHYVLWGKLNSAKAQRVRARFEERSMKAIYLHGRKILGADLYLRAGANDLRLVYAADPGPYGSFSASQYGPWFRLEGAAGQRAEGLSYQLPELAAK